MNATISSRFGSIVALDATYWGGAVANSMLGNIAQLLYADEHNVDFVRVVGELHRTLSQRGDSGLSFSWDGENLASFDLSVVRIVLGVKYRPSAGCSTCLTVAVELSANESEPFAGCEETCSSVVEYLNRRYPASTTIWHHLNEPLTHNLHDRLVAALPPLTLTPTDQAPDQVAGAGSPERLHLTEAAEIPGEPRNENAAPPARPSPEPESALSLMRGAKGAEQMARKSRPRASENAQDRAAKARARGGILIAAHATGALPVPKTVNDNPACLEMFDTEFARVRDTLNQKEPAPRLSTPLRLTAHALNASLIMVWAPLGAAVMAYSLLMGEDMKFSGRLAVLTGLFATAIRTPSGQHLAAMIGV